MAARTWVVAAVMTVVVAGTAKGCDPAAMPASATGTLNILNGCAFIGALDDGPVALIPGSSYDVGSDGVYYLSGPDPVAVTGDMVRVEGESGTGRGCLEGLLPAGGTSINVSRVTFIGHGT